MSSEPSSSAGPSTSGSGSATGSTVDAPTAAWFGEFCGGLTPIYAVAKADGLAITAIKTNPAGAKAGAVDFLQKVGTGFTATGAKLKTLAPPTFTGGAAFATKQISNFEKKGPAYTAQAKAIQAVDSTDLVSLATAISKLTSLSADIAGPVLDVSNLPIDAQLKQNLLKVPACEKLQATAGS